MIAIIGGTGLEKPEILKKMETKTVKTPFGKTAAPIRIGTLNGKKIALVSRHGFNHEFSPSVVPYQANIWAIRKLGITNVLATSTCGSLREKIRPSDFVVPDQVIDFTKYRLQTYKDGQGLDAHTSFGDPFSQILNQALLKSLKELGYRHHANKTVVTIEGPRFASRAESLMYRKLGADIINMTTSTEAILCRELGICYSVLAIATDYDCWKTDRKPVTDKEILEVMAKNSQRVLKTLLQTIPKINSEKHCKEH